MDRNKAVFVCPVVPAESLPSRGAWIEITAQDVSDLEYQSSLPSRGAWIEIFSTGKAGQTPAVAPLAGSVDRNH